MGDGMAIQVIWLILIIAAVFLYMLTGNLLWKAAYLIFVCYVPVVLFFFPGGFFPVAECSVEEKSMIAVVTLETLLFIFLYHFCVWLKMEEKEIPEETILWLLTPISISIGLFYGFYVVTDSSILFCLTVCVICPVVFLQQFAAHTAMQWKKENWLARFRAVKMSGRIVFVMALFNLAVLFCFFAGNRFSLWCALFLVYSQLCLILYRMCCLLERKGQTLHGMLLWVLVYLIFGIIMICNLHMEMNGNLMWVIKIILGIVVPGAFLAGSLVRIGKHWKAG